MVPGTATTTVTRPSTEIAASPTTYPAAGRPRFGYRGRYRHGIRRRAKMIPARIATPIGLAGFVLAALFLLAQQLIKSNKFPRLNTAISGSLINRLFSLAVIAMALGLFGLWVMISCYQETRPRHTHRRDRREGECHCWHSRPVRFYRNLPKRCVCYRVTRPVH